MTDNCDVENVYKMIKQKNGQNKNMKFNGVKWNYYRSQMCTKSNSKWTKL